MSFATGNLSWKFAYSAYASQYAFARILLPCMLQDVDLHENCSLLSSAFSRSMVLILQLQFFKENLFLLRHKIIILLSQYNLSLCFSSLLANRLFYGKLGLIRGKFSKNKLSQILLESICWCFRSFIILLSSEKYRIINLSQGGIIYISVFKLRSDVVLRDVYLGT